MRGNGATAGTVGAGVGDGVQRLVLAAAAVWLAAAATACGGRNGDGGAATVQIGGSWSGTWNSDPTGYTGTLVAQITQVGSQLAGTIQATGSPCLTIATLTGTVTGNDIHLDAVAGVDLTAFNAVLCPPRLSDSIDEMNSSPAVTCMVDGGTGSQDSIRGRYAASIGTCVGNAGTFQLSR